MESTDYSFNQHASLPTGDDQAHYHNATRTEESEEEVAFLEDTTAWIPIVPVIPEVRTAELMVRGPLAYQEDY